MSEALTLVNREFKGDVDSSSRRSFTLKLNAHFPSYFGDFCSFKRFLVLEMPAAFAKRRLSVAFVRSAKFLLQPPLWRLCNTVNKSLWTRNVLSFGRNSPAL